MLSMTAFLSDWVADWNTDGQRLHAALHADLELSPTESTQQPSKSSARSFLVADGWLSARAATDRSHAPRVLLRIVCIWPARSAA
jgi:hypothetical protein